MERKYCMKCLCCRSLPDCVDFWSMSGMPFPDYGCNEFALVSFRALLRRFLEVL